MLRTQRARRRVITALAALFFRTVDNPVKKQLYRLATGKRTGLRGLELSYGDHRVRVAPTTMLAASERFGKVVERFFEEAGVNHKSFAPRGR